MGFCDLPIANKLCTAADVIDFANDPGKAITEGIGNWIAKSVGELAMASSDLAVEGITATTKIDLNATWFRDNYETLLPIGLVMLVATMCAQLVRAAVKRDGQALSQAFTGTFMGVIFAFSAIGLTTIAIEVVDALSDGLFAAAGTSMEEAVRRSIKVSVIGGVAGLGWMVPAFVGIGAAVGAFMFWCVMLMRKVGILVLVTLAVFAGAGGGWEVARRWRRGWIEATATLVVSKLLMTVIFILGISALGETQGKEGTQALADIMAGIVIMCLVLLAPYATFRFVHWAAEGADGESLHRAGGAGAQVARQHTEQAARKAATMAATGGAGGAAAGSAAPQGPDSLASGGFPGDIASQSSGGEGQKQGSQEGGGMSPAMDALTKAVQPPPTSPQQDTSGQPGGPSGQQPGGGPPASPDSGSTQWSGRGTGSPPPQGAAPSTDTGQSTGPAAPTPPPAGN
ncbi:ATP-binding protein [Streptomyces sp. H27-H1]|uniref:SCO6881 family protein n=1 Tax=Streptomyces sp. H27-H1 TaxID=2996461 RepID=UPI002271BAA6|nr:ATP-binding protein [Streptomyces sp. H27-H1]MCY0928226.1 ATP-binding protein [Streptomyces sp. H27-H1]